MNTVTSKKDQNRNKIFLGDHYVLLTENKTQNKMTNIIGFLLESLKCLIYTQIPFKPLCFHELQLFPGSGWSDPWANSFIVTKLSRIIAPLT